MTWLTTLYKTYDELEKLNEMLPFEQQVMPICHTLQNAHIHIVINNQGEFVRAEVLEKAQIVLPATEQSAGRSSGLCAHALADKIQYVAKDYADFGGIKKSGFELYQAQLKAWCDSEHGHPAVCAVYQYIEKGTVVADLVAESVLHEQDGHLLTKWQDDGEAPALLKILPKEKGLFDQGSALVCWSVETPGEPQSKTWLDPSIQQSWIAFDSQNGDSTAMCYATGEEKLAASNHPAKIRHSGDKAKLISANDKSGYTFRGRFLSNEEACNISFEVTQKAHNALRCLLTKQSVFRNGDQVYLAWAVSGKEVPKPTELDFSDFASLLEETDSVDHTQDLGRAYANQLKRYFNGIKTKNQLDDNEQIALLGLDSATPGRMGILYYRETIAKEFLARLEQWQLDLGWQQRVKINEQWQWVYSAPSLFRVLDGVYGDVLKSADTLKKNLITRLYPCIVEGKSIPQDIMHSAFHRAINRVAYKSDQTWLWLQNLGIACSLIKGFYIRTTHSTIQKEYPMALQQDNASRDYLFGRLLAVANKIEKVALSSSEANRLTTAERFMTQFVNRPASTWLNISNALVPYQQRLFNNYQGYDNATKALLMQITDRFNPADFTSNQKLTPEFLLGFHNQMMWLETHKVEKGQWVKKVNDEQVQENLEETV
ncbi:type I-C CRISPR-associated protein Cas8c/Csd1 [Vibrio sp. V27_P1S3P104]|uniref:type I-C CRISPR-associated protein Cas8c/Csd1 n=1 Tax=unclassified Vibrio TaxID=2614977 RepID=UPI001372976B|nr:MULTISPECIES: type I-C CRISPR-associated protein Cas8c/Csd1 [unclassified Vibrio]NAW70299.1 type I-C CRISPR-associated protein Cas8c/Csd1 [Vibrio sp. V28_P6S34P95]NAX05256.1 type I-C CRISPR-associated protein Cas8c/Csd1 [Vibrio sp. V30_P3S12P165]NAX33786.1 type I-C CRISPR-associated protein Cas8c/Csd1 [Vibrio sp. V29_P1S30P107]NAX37478.1 type I-C CRISPR-associated protein Cas8c/Csd1 [Vibrio sp. V27_P1S3P104]NAX41625.1 type I-C CRISPR-associated protein Cas8c/Csd1 [Vibrio sp. V26_P1S5P106]